VKSLKLLVSPAAALSPTGGVTLAHPGAEPGEIGETGRRVVVIVEIPDDVPAETVRRLFVLTADVTWLGGREPRRSFAWSELGEGVIIRE
jgi:hypothetical protein